MHRIFPTIALLLAAPILWAGNIRGVVTDKSGEGLPQASLRLLSQRDSSFVKGVSSNLSGDFLFQNVKGGKYIVEASYLGYDPVFRDVNVGSGDIRIDTVVMQESSVLLKDVVVTGTKTQIKVMEDTVEYNADSYKTAPNAVVEDLLKRLPGVEVGSDGTITANGKSVSKILVDGKEFFGDDPTVASKNLPVDMVDKLQVVDRKSELARLTGVDDGDDETVINLKVKKGMNNGWFGNVEAGYGTDSRYAGSFNVNRFWNGNQITFLGNANNVNDPGFNDGMGGRFRRFGGDDGIAASQAFGVNFNVGKEEMLRVGGNVMYSHTERDTREHRERQYLFTDSTSFANTFKSTVDRGHNLRGDFRLEWKPDSFNTIDFRPRFVWSKNNSRSNDSTMTLSGLREMVNSSINRDNSDGKSLELGARLIYTHNFKSKRGRSMSVMLNYSRTDTKEWGESFARNIFYLFSDSLDVYDQRMDNHTWNSSLLGRASWTEPIGNPKRGNYLTFAYGINFRWNDADKLVYDRLYTVEPLLISDPIAAFAASVMNDGQYIEQYNDTLSNRFRNSFYQHELRVGYKHVTKTQNVEVGFSAIPSKTTSSNLTDHARDIQRTVWNYSPFLRYRWKISNTRSFNANYRGRSSQPSIAQMQPVPDYSDPLRVVIGNPSLDPSFNHWMNIRYQDFNTEAQRSVMLMGMFNYIQNSIVSSTRFNPHTGAQETRYLNVNGVWNARVMNMVSMPFRDKRWQFSNHLFANFSHQVGFNNGLRNISMQYNITEMPSLSFRPDNVEIELRPTYSLQYTTNTLKTSDNMLVHRYGATLDAYYSTPIGIVLQTDCTYSGTKGYARGYDTDTWMWNASVSYEFLRDRSATLSVKAYDLLQQKNNIRRNVTANYIDDASYNALTRYFMVSFSYKFNTFGKGNEPKTNDMMRQGPPGGPGGPPPGMSRRHMPPRP